MDQINFTPIGFIHSPFTQIHNMPVQPAAAKGVKGSIIINEEYVDGLSDLEGFSHIYLLYYLHLSKSYELKVIPFLDNQQRGVFSTRAPKRPNPIGLSVVKLIKIKFNIIEVENVDMIDGTPVLDIKPYIPEMEGVVDYEIGWLSDNKEKIRSQLSDKRFD